MMNDNVNSYTNAHENKKENKLYERTNQIVFIISL